MSDEDDFYFGYDVITNGETVTINIGRYPRRKSYALYIMKPGLSTVVTYLRSRKEAQEMAALLKILAEGRVHG